MLFNLVMVVLLAFVPLLIIVAQTTTVFDNGKWLQYLQFGNCTLLAFYYPLGYGFWFTLFITAITVYFVEYFESMGQ